MACFYVILGYLPKLKYFGYYYDLLLDMTDSSLTF